MIITPHFILIPHAGKIYAGDCRNKIFNKLKHHKIKNIIYITALHNYIYTKKHINFIIKDECKLFHNNKNVYPENSLSDSVYEHYNFILLTRTFTPPKKPCHYAMICP